jgi:hypothetical protein
VTRNGLRNTCIGLFGNPQALYGEPAGARPKARGWGIGRRLRSCVNPTAITKGVNVNRFRFAVVLAAAAAAALTAGSALSVTKPVPFKASIAGKAVVNITGDSATISATGAGVATPLGKVKMTAAGAGSQSDPCPLFGGTAVLTSPTGTLKFKVPPASGKGCTDEQGTTFALIGRATIAGGTKKYAKAKGSFKFTGTFDKGTGLYSVKFTGLLTL